jgi:hypothetical protein
VSLKGKAITLVTIPRFDVALRDTTSPRLDTNKFVKRETICEEGKRDGDFGHPTKTKKYDWTKTNLAQNAL